MIPHTRMPLAGDSEIKRVFVSSTSSDLQPERRAVDHALRQMRSTLITAMEYFGSQPLEPKDVCLSEVARSDVYVGIFASRYGHTDPATGLSMTELEYREARVRNLPCLIYLKSSTAAPFQNEEHDPDASRKLEKLKSDLRKFHVVTNFEDPDNLATRVVLDLHNLLLEHRLPTPSQPAARANSITPKDYR